MGGGALWRGVAKVIQSPGVGLGLVAPASAPSSSVRVASASMMQASAAAAPSLRFPASDEWELAGGEEEHRGSIRDSLMFGSQPSLDEVSEATTDLRNALGICVGDECVCTPQGLSPPVSSPRKETSSSSRLGHPVDWMEPHLVCHSPGTVQVRRRNEVADAFHLLQTDPLVQGVVMSIASDKAVWEAVLNNEKVREFRKKLQDSNTGVEDCTVDQKTGENTTIDGGVKNLLDSFMDFSKGACMQLKSMLSEMVAGVLHVFDKFFGDKMFGETSSDLADKAIKSCCMLSFLVLSIVLLKRASI